MKFQNTQILKLSILGLLLVISNAAPDDCECNGEYYLQKNLNDRTKDQCIKNPTEGDSAISNCQSYSHDGTNLKCIGCKAGYYLKSASECATNPTQGQPGYDAECAYYGPDAKCTVCKVKKWLDSNKNCQEPTKIIHDCYKYSDATTCSECEKGKLIDETTGDCIQDKPTNGVNNCGSYKVSAAQYTCISCMHNYFLEGSECKQVTNKIETCYLYSSNGQCSLCDFGTHLQDNKCQECPHYKGGNAGVLQSSILLLFGIVLVFLF